MKRVIGIVFIFILMIVITGCGCSKEKDYSVICSKKIQEGKISYTENVGADLKNGKIEEIVYEFKFENKDIAQDYLDTINSTHKNAEIKLDDKTITVKQKVLEDKKLTNDDFKSLWKRLGYNCK